MIYGGEHVTSSTVAPLGVTTFAEFIRDFIVEPVVVNVTRAEFRALPTAEQNKVKQVPYFTACTFTGNRRTTSEAGHCNLLCLDIDDPAQAAPLTDPEVLSRIMKGYGYAAYTTARSTPEDPRLRLVVRGNCSALDYPDCIRALADHLGLPSGMKGLTESMIPVQPMFRPTMFLGDTPEDNPLVTWLDGAAYTETRGSSVEDLLGAEEPPGDGVDDLVYLRGPLDGVTTEEIEECLQHISPDCSYKEWITVAAGLRHQFVREWEAGYKLFDEWSSKGNKYQGPEDTLRKWKSFDAAPRDRHPVTLASVLSMGSKAGWDGAKTAAKCYYHTLEWIQSDERTIDDLLEKTAALIYNTPLTTPVQQGHLRAAWQKAMADRGYKASPADIKKEIKAVAADRTKEDAIKNLPKWARGWTYVADANRFHHRATMRDFMPESLDSCMGRHMNPDEFGKVATRPRDFLLNVAQIPTVDGVRYAPNLPNQTHIRIGTRKYLNTYIPTFPRAVHDPEVDAMIMTHMDGLILEPEYRAIFISWVAFMVQHPGRKIRWAPLLQGVQGCGKSIVGNFARVALGHDHVMELQANQIYNQIFNSYAEGKQLVVLEETRIIGKSRHETMDRLKPLITNDKVSIRGMRRDLREVDNVTNYLLLTNYHDSLAIDNNDRRYFVLESRMQQKHQVATTYAPDHFPKMFQARDNKGGAIRHFFENYKICDTFDPDGPAPVTTYHENLTVSAQNPLQRAVSETLADEPSMLVTRSLVSLQALRTEIPRESVPPYSDQALAGVLREMGFTFAERIQHQGVRHTVWFRPDMIETKMAAADLFRRALDRRLDDLLG